MSNTTVPSEPVRGCHHCIGAARTVTDVIFSTLHSRAIANGGVISASEIKIAQAQFIEKLPTGFELFELVHKECMDTSASHAPEPFSRDMILSTLLSACGKGSAKHVFKVQTEQCGIEWFGYFFYAFSLAAQDNLSHASRARLIDAYVDAAGKYKSSLTVMHLLNDARIAKILSKCIAPFLMAAEIDNLSLVVSDRVNEYISTKYNFTGAYIAKITSAQVKQFFELLRKEAALTLHAA
jgi:hypothetical protein